MEGANEITIAEPSDWPQTEADVIEAFGGSRAVSDKLGMSQSRVSNWKTYGIPAERWPDMIKLAAQAGISGITLDRLAAMRRARDKPRRPAT